MWPTPMGMAGLDKTGKTSAGGEFAKMATNWPTPRAISGGGESGQRKQELLREDSGGGDLQSEAQRWPTPAARDEKAPNVNETHATDQPGNVSSRWQTPRTGTKGPPGEDSTHGGQPTGKRLNPTFVEWLMGFPPNWTTLQPVALTAFGRWVTRSFLLSRALLSSSSPANSPSTSDD